MAVTVLRGSVDRAGRRAQRRSLSERSDDAATGRSGRERASETHVAPASRTRACRLDGRTHIRMYRLPMSYVCSILDAWSRTPSSNPLTPRVRMRGWATSMGRPCRTSWIWCSRSRRWRRCSPRSGCGGSTRCGGNCWSRRRVAGWGSTEVIERGIRLELATAMRVTEYAAGRMITLADALVHRYPAVLESLAGGRITLKHAEILVDAVDRADARPARRGGGARLWNWPRRSRSARSGAACRP